MINWLNLIYDNARMECVSSSSVSRTMVDVGWPILVVT